MHSVGSVDKDDDKIDIIIPVLQGTTMMTHTQGNSSVDATMTIHDHNSQDTHTKRWENSHGAHSNKDNTQSTIRIVVTKTNTHTRRTVAVVVTRVTTTHRHTDTRPQHCRDGNGGSTAPHRITHNSCELLSRPVPLFN